MLKKLALSALATAMLTTTAMAYSADGESANSMSSIDFGYGKTSFDTLTNDSINTYSLTYNFMATDALTFLPEGFGVGAGFNFDVISGSEIPDAFSTIGGELKIGYTFNKKFNIPVYLRAGAGYGYTYNSNTVLRGGGFQWSTDATVRIYKKFGVGVRYRSLSPNFSDGLGDENFKSVMGYVSFGW